MDRFLTTLQKRIFEDELEKRMYPNQLSRYLQHPHTLTQEQIGDAMDIAMNHEPHHKNNQNVQNIL